jgi:DNA-directed RNA polymerase subunit E'/Rpb7
MDYVTLEKRVCIDNDKLNKNIHEHILTKLKESTINDCTKEHGYILDIKKIINIKDNYISNVNCDTIFLVEFLAQTLKPEIGKKFDGQVCMVFPGGIFLNIKDKQKVLIPISTLNNYTYDLINKNFKNNKKIIKEGDTIKVEITGTKYSKQSFSCFGNMIEKD